MQERRDSRHRFRFGAGEISAAPVDRRGDSCRPPSCTGFENIVVKSCHILFITALSWVSAIAGITASSGKAAEPAEYFEVMKVAPREKIDHRVRISVPFKGDMLPVRLRGPVYFSQPLVSPASSEKPPRKPPAILNWYTVQEPALQIDRTLLLADFLSDRPYRVKLAEPMYLLSPAQKVTTGDPAAIPQDLNYFLAYRIEQSDQPVDAYKNLVIERPPERKLLSPYLVCLPIEERHHFDHFPVKAKGVLLVVYKATPHSHEENVSTLDQFGFNRLKMLSNDWIYIKGRLLSKE